MKNIIFFIISLSFVSCRQVEVDFSKITSLKVHTLPYGIHPFGRVTREDCLAQKPHLIEKKEVLDSIKYHLRSLQEAGKEGDFDIQSPYTICFIYFSDGSFIELSYDRFYITLNGKKFKDNPELMDILVKDADYWLK